MLKRQRRRAAQLQRRLYDLLEDGRSASRASFVVDRALILLILLNLVSVALESVPELAHRYVLWFDAVEIVSLVVFTLEYAARLWIAGLHPPFRHLSAHSARWNYAVSGAGIIDLLAVLPFWFAFFLPIDLRVCWCCASSAFSSWRAIRPRLRLAARSALCRAPCPDRLRRDPSGATLISAS